MPRVPPLTRFIVTRVIADKRAPKRAQRSGWIVFDTHNPLDRHQFFTLNTSAKQYAERMNQTTA